jgi:CDP-glycerol glycerophosphotransferase (TagB/SpsB family)
MSDSTLNEIYLHILEELGDKYKIILRKHPRQVISSEMNNKIKDLNYRYKNLFFQKGSESINDVLNNSFIHITAHSGTFFEALHFKIPTIFLSQRATEYFHTFIQSKYFINCTNSTKEEITQKIRENAP